MAGELVRAKEQSSTPREQPHRCWDGLLGCEQQFDKRAFRLHPLLCERCSQGVALRFSISYSDIEFMTMLLAQDASLYRTAAYFGANKDKVRTMELRRDHYLGELFQAVRAAKDPKKVAAVGKSYRDWFFQQVGLEFPNERAKPAPKGMVSVAEVAV
jgi:hypothetical protein